MGRRPSKFNLHQLPGHSLPVKFDLTEYYLTENETEQSVSRHKTRSFGPTYDHHLCPDCQLS